jgi:hypothetical protein
LAASERVNQRSHNVERQIINEIQTLTLCMTADTKPGKQARREIARIVMAWYRGKLLPRSEAPLLMRVYEKAHYGPPPQTPGRHDD